MNCRSRFAAVLPSNRRKRRGESPSEAQGVGDLEAAQTHGQSRRARLPVHRRRGRRPLGGDLRRDAPPGGLHRPHRPRLQGDMPAVRPGEGEQDHGLRDRQGGVPDRAVLPRERDRGAEGGGSHWGQCGEEERRFE